MNESNIKVAIRARPPMTSNQPWNINSNTNSISMIGASNIYTYDRVYNWTSSTDEIYNDMAKDIIDGVMTGTNGTIFAYGSTGSGKTYTMTGTDSNPGIIPIAIDHIFNHIRENKNRGYLVSFSYFEIYMEKIRDLLIRNGQLEKNFNFSALDAECSTFMKEKIRTSTQNRSTGSTDMNHYSSRSHAIVRINVKSSPKDFETGISLQSTLDLVDLAGSECQRYTNAEGERKLEAAAINKSLLALTKVIDSLQKQSLHCNIKQQPLPYRDSKLTMILKDSLGGNAQTMIICNISSDYDQKSTSESSLRFAMNAMCVINDPKVNKICDKDNLEYWKNKVKELEKELAKRQSHMNENDIDTCNDLYSQSNEKYEFGMKEHNNMNSFTNDDHTDTDFTNDSTPLILPLKILTRNTENAAKRMITQQRQQNESIEEEDTFNLQFPNEIIFQPSPIQLPKKRKEKRRTMDEIELSSYENDHEAEYLAHSMNTIPFLEEKIVILTNSNDELKASNENLLQVNHEFTEKIQELETLLQAKSTFSFRDSNEKDRKIEELTKANEELKIKITRKEAEAKGAMLTNNVYKKQLEKKDITIIQLGERIQTKSNECQEYKKQLEAIEQNKESIKYEDSSTNTEMVMKDLNDYKIKIHKMEREINDKEKIIKALQQQNKIARPPLVSRDNLINVLKNHSNQMYENVSPNDAIANLKSRLGQKSKSYSRKTFVFETDEIAHIYEAGDSDFYDISIIPNKKDIILHDSYGIQTDKTVLTNVGVEANEPNECTNDELEEECNEMVDIMVSLSISESINKIKFEERKIINDQPINEVDEGIAVIDEVELPNINARNIRFEGPHYMYSIIQLLNMLVQTFMLVFLMTN